MNYCLENPATMYLTEEKAINARVMGHDLIIFGDVKLRFYDTYDFAGWLVETITDPESAREWLAFIDPREEGPRELSSAWASDRKVGTSVLEELFRIVDLYLESGRLDEKESLFVELIEDLVKELIRIMSIEHEQKVNSLRLVNEMVTWIRSTYWKPFLTKADAMVICAYVAGKAHDVKFNTIDN